MKTQLLFWSILISIFTIGNAQEEIITFTDVNFKNALLNYSPVIDTDGDLEISIKEAEAVISLDISKQNISNLSGIDFFTSLTSLGADKNNLTEINVSNNTNLTHLYLHENNLTEIDVSNNINLKTLSIYRNALISIDVSNLSELTRLRLFSNKLTEIDISNNTKLTSITLYSNKLTEIDLKNNIDLNYVSLNSNRLNEITVSHLSNLRTLYLSSNNLTEIDVTNNSNLTGLNLSGNSITEIDISNNNLRYLNMNYNGINEIDLSNKSSLVYLYLNGTNISTLDVSDCSLITLDFVGCPNLQEVFMTGQALRYLTVSGEERFDINLASCPNLQFICADQEYLNDIYGILEDASQTDVQLSNNCADPHNRIQGTVTFDTDNDGCGDADDAVFTGGLRYSAISLSTGNSFVAYPNEEGQYTLHIADDVYFLGPALENFEYFTFSEPIFQAPTFIPAQLASLTTDYCIQPLGNFDDLEINIIPIDRAQPGFESTYRISYQNKGTTTQSGTVTLEYQENVLDYISSTPTITSNTNGQITWDFVDLLPMETVEIPLILELNRPTDTPALVGGEVLNFTATITGSTDETPQDNVIALAQTVVNSYDPNDKTCLEGGILDPDNVGGYLHYLIRFENEGTAEARTIRVTDIIDTTKFDIESFVPLKSSHSYSTTITNGSEIEFTFNNINLPFDDENNDGYINFKIKTLDTLTEGEEIVNRAAIYFDYNFPIITEDSVVEVKRDEVKELGFSDYFTISPNPTTGIMNLTVLDDSIDISYILLYDMGGNLVGYYLGTTRTINVSHLFPNSYIMKIVSNKGELSTQFIKL